MAFTNVEGAEIYYECHGSGDPLLLISGLNGNAGWEPQIGEFSRHFQVIVHDQRGSGRSTKSRISYSVDQIAQDTLGLMNALGIERAHIVGHSLGAAVGQWLAIEAPHKVGRLVLASGWAKADEFLRRTMVARRRILQNSGPEAYINASALYLYPPTWINAHQQELKASDARAVSSFIPDITASRIDAVLAFESADRLSAIVSPTLVIVASDDILTPPHLSKALADQIPNVRLAVLSYGAHRMAHVAPEAFNSEVVSFLTRECSAPNSPVAMART